MGLRIPEPPSDSLTALRNALGALAERGQFGAHGLRKARPEQVSATAPHQVFNVSLEDAAVGRVAEAAKPSGWRYLLEVDEHVVASAETRLTDGEAHVFSLINEGPFVSGTTEALPLAEEVGQQRDIDLELRLVNVPAVHLMALWLEPQRTADEGQRVFIPIAPAPRGIEANRVHGDEEFTGRLRALAQAIPVLRADDTRGGG